MTEKPNLDVTLELSSQEFLDHDGGLMVRCQKCRKWVPLTDYYSEVDGSLLPLVGNAECEQEDREHNIDTGERIMHPQDPSKGLIPVMAKETVAACGWKETVRIVQKDETPPEGGTLEVKVHDAVGMTDKFGG